LKQAVCRSVGHRNWKMVKALPGLGFSKNSRF
jgi:hypothetical protein